MAEAPTFVHACISEEQIAGQPQTLQRFGWKNDKDIKKRRALAAGSVETAVGSSGIYQISIGSELSQQRGAVNQEDVPARSYLPISGARVLGATLWWLPATPTLTGWTPCEGGNPSQLTPQAARLPVKSCILDLTCSLTVFYWRSWRSRSGEVPWACIFPQLYDPKNECTGKDRVYPFFWGSKFSTLGKNECY